MSRFAFLLREPTEWLMAWMGGLHIIKYNLPSLALKIVDFKRV